MQSYAILLTCPMAIMVQHLYSETRISFNKYIRIIGIHFVLNIVFLHVLNYFLSISDKANIEYILSYIVGLVVAMIIAKFEPKKSLDEYEAYENIVIFAQMFLGIVIIFCTLSKWFENKVYLQIPYGDIVLSKIVFIRLGGSYIFYNRYFFTRIRNLIRK